MSDQRMSGRRRREKFLPQEDEMLRQLVDKYGPCAWEQIAREMPGRNVRQCRERWKHYLSGTASKEPWTEEEDQLLFEKMKEIGPKWTKLTQFFKGRTDIQIKARWMQRFANISNLHIRRNNKRMPMFSPTNPWPNPVYIFVPNGAIPPDTLLPSHVQVGNQLMPVHSAEMAAPPKPPTPEMEQDQFDSLHYDCSFGSYSFLDIYNMAQ